MIASRMTEWQREWRLVETELSSLKTEPPGVMTHQKIDLQVALMKRRAELEINKPKTWL
jgi:hypothetical protein|tara:strand:+ start:153 stop:329 length:177 start_codon:yes stop_codon:yes gene_type:complete